MMFDFRKIFAVPKDFLKSKIYCTLFSANTIGVILWLKLNIWPIEWSYLAGNSSKKLVTVWVASACTRTLNLWNFNLPGSSSCNGKCQCWGSCRTSSFKINWKIFKVSMYSHCGILEHWRSQKSLTSIRQHFSCRLDVGIAKICNFFFNGFLRLSDLSVILDFSLKRPKN